MTDAFVTVVVDEDPASAAAAIAEIDGVERAVELRGEYDVVAELDLPDPDALQRVVTGEIQTVDGVAETTTAVTPELAAHHRADEGRKR